MSDLFTDRLSDYLDDELDATERADVAEHLATCAECRATLAQLERVVRRAATLPDTAPATDRWQETAAAIRGASIVPIGARRRRTITITVPQLAAASLLIAAAWGGTVWMARNRTGTSRTITVASAPETVTTHSVDTVTAIRQTQPVLSTGPTSGMVPVVRHASPVGTSVTPSPARFPDAEFADAVADLERVVKDGRSSLDTATVRALEESLRTIDRALGQARSALAKDPSNAYLNDHLAETMKRKLQLLRDAAALVGAQT